MEKNKFIDSIDDYLMGRLDNTDRMLFLKELEQDADLAGAVKLRQELLNGVEAFGRQNLKDQLKEIHQEVIPSQKTPAKRRRLLPYLMVAASILLLVFALSRFLQEPAIKSTPELYAAYFSPYDIPSSQRNATNELDLQIADLYNNKKYSMVLPLLEEKLASLNPQPSNLLLAKGIALLETNQAEKALLSFQQITTNKDFNFEDEVTWYSALAYLKMDDAVTAQLLIEPLASKPNADHHAKAKQLLNELKK